MRKNDLLPHLALLVVNLVYGLNYVLAKDVMPYYIKPSGFILLRVACSVVLFWLFHAFYRQEKIERKDFPRLAAGGLFGVAINQLLFFQGLNISSPINASIIMTITPITILIMGFAFLGEKITRARIAGVALGIGGAITLILFNAGTGDISGNVLGNLYIIINAFSYAFFLVIAKPLMKKYKPLTVIKWVFLFGCIFVLPFGAKELSEARWQEFSFDIIWKTAFIIFWVTFITYLLNIYALKFVDSSVVGIYIYIQPVVAAAHAIALGRDELSWIMVICSLAIFTGVILVGRKPREHG